MRKTIVKSVLLTLFAELVGPTNRAQNRVIYQSVSQPALEYLYYAISAVPLSPRQKYQLARPTRALAPYRSETREDYYIFMTALVDLGEAPEK
jgi:hypothetical protein